MNYELAKQLKDKGFEIKDFTKHWFWHKGERYLYFNGFGDDWEGSKNIFDYAFEPTLSELLEACGDEFRMLATKNDYAPNEGWGAMGARQVRKWHSFYGEGSTPEEAVANLWLKLNNK